LKGIIVLDSIGHVVGIHKWGGNVPANYSPPMAIPENGKILNMDGEGMETMLALLRAGQRIVVKDGNVTVEGVTIGSINDRGQFNFV
jgi:hypothetical protein